MNINDFLLRYRKPFFAPADEGAPAPAADTAAPAADSAPAADAPGDKPAQTALGGDKPSDEAPKDGEPDADAPKDGDDKGDDAGDGDDADAGEFKLSAPEGMENFQGEFDTFSSEASEWMQANPDATPADALKWAAERQAAAVGKQTSEMSEAFSKQIETWEGEARADKEIGGDSFDANLAIAKGAIEAFGDDDLKAVLNESGLGSHPAVIKFAVKAGKPLADAKVISPNASAGGGDALKSRYNSK